MWKDTCKGGVLACSEGRRKCGSVALPEEDFISEYESPSVCEFQSDGR